MSNFYCYREKRDGYIYILFHAITERGNVSSKKSIASSQELVIHRYGAIIQQVSFISHVNQTVPLFKLVL